MMSSSPVQLPDPKAVPEYVDPAEWRKYCHDTREYYANQSQGNMQEEVGVSVTEGVIQPLNMSEGKIFGKWYEDCSDTLYRYSIYCLLGLIAGCSLILPAIMLYVGVRFYYCDDIFAPWLIVGGVICYINCLLFFINWKENKTLNIRKVANKCKYWVFLVFSGITVIWWLLGFVRIFGPAHRKLRNSNSSDLGMYDDPMMEDPVCKFYLFTFPYWITLVPFIFIFLFIFLFLCYACCMCCDNDDD